MNLPAALRSAAKSAGMNDVQIAAAVGVSQVTVGRWLSGSREPRGKHLIALIDAVPGFGERIGLQKVAA
jgi:transcriptional regulator with XRE-family HTH domain